MPTKTSNFFKPIIPATKKCQSNHHVVCMTISKWKWNLKQRLQLILQNRFHEISLIIHILHLSQNKSKVIKKLSHLFVNSSYVSSLGLYILCLLWFQHCCPSVWNSLPSSIRACSSSHTFHGFLNRTVSSRPSVPISSSHKCLRFGHWLTLHTRRDFN